MCAALTRWLGNKTTCENQMPSNKLAKTVPKIHVVIYNASK